MSGGKNQKFMQDPLAFMRRYSVCVGDDIEGDIGDKAVSMPNAMDRGGYVFSPWTPPSASRGSTSTSRRAPAST